MFFMSLMRIRRVVHYSTLVLSGKPHRGWWNTKPSAKNEKDLEIDVYKRKPLHRIDRIICSNLISYYNDTILAYTHQLFYYYWISKDI